MHIEYEVEMDSGEKHKVACDGRDYAKMEVQEFPPGAVVTKARFLAWSAMTRQQLTTVSFKKFNEELCVDLDDITKREVEPLTEDEEYEQAAAGGLNPTRPGTASSASRSRGGKVSR